MTTKEKPRVKPKDFTYTHTDGTKYTLTEKEKRFCDYYLQFGAKGIDAVYEAGYDVKTKNSASVIAYENLRKPHIYNYINSKYEEYGFNDEDVMKEHLFLIKQQADLPSKGRGIDMYYKKKGSYAEQKIAHTVRNYRDLPDEELEKIHNAKTNRETTE